MSKYISVIHTDIDHVRLQAEVLDFITRHDLGNLQQISLTSVLGDDDWYCAVGKIHNLQYPERYYSVLNKSLTDSYTAELLSRYPEYYRWRLLKLEGKHTYTVHSDGDGVSENIRLHIPVMTNPQAFLCFLEHKPTSGDTVAVEYQHLEAGNSYRVNTTGQHTAVNYDFRDRYHIVGVKYESSNNRSQ